MDKILNEIYGSAMVYGLQFMKDRVVFSTSCKFFMYYRSVENSLTLLVIRNFIKTYIKKAGKLLIGIFEGKSFQHLTKQIKFRRFSFGEFPENFDHFQPYLEKSMKRFPVLEQAELENFFQDQNLYA